MAIRAATSSYALRLVGLAVAIAALDVVLTARRVRSQRMMSKQEVRQEVRDNEGNPFVRAARRAVHSQILQAGPRRGLANATVAVANPTHILVALRYDDTECDAPYLVAKGLDADALAMRRSAIALGIPTVENVALARALARQPLGEGIPDELYEATAAVIQFAQQRAPDVGVRRTSGA